MLGCCILFRWIFIFYWERACREYFLVSNPIHSYPKYGEVWCVLCALCTVVFKTWNILSYFCIHLFREISCHHPCIATMISGGKMLFHFSSLFSQLTASWIPGNRRTFRCFWNIKSLSGFLCLFLFTKLPSQFHWQFEERTASFSPFFTFSCLKRRFSQKIPYRTKGYRYLVLFCEK